MYLRYFFQFKVDAVSDNPGWTTDSDEQGIVSPLSVLIILNSNNTVTVGALLQVAKVERSKLREVDPAVDVDENVREEEGVEEVDQMKDPPDLKHFPNS